MAITLFFFCLKCILMFRTTVRNKHADCVLLHVVALWSCIAVFTGSQCCALSPIPKLSPLLDKWLFCSEVRWSFEIFCSVTWTSSLLRWLLPKETCLCLSFPHGYAANEAGNRVRGAKTSVCLMENARSHQRDPSGESWDMPDYSSVSFTRVQLL